MKIKHLLNETDDGLFEKITSTSFFKNNYEEKVRYAVQNDIEFHYMEDIVWLFHASNKLPDQSGVMSQKYREKPLDSSPLFHGLVNNYSIKKLNVPVRNLLFCHTIKHKVSEYADNTYVIFPLSDDYTLYYADAVDDMTNYYKVSSFNTYEVNRKFDDFAKKYGIDEYKEYVPRELVIGIQSSENVDELREKVGNMFKMIEYTTEKFSIEELTDKFVEFFMNDYNAKAQDYVSRLKSTKSLFKNGLEIMVKSEQMAYLDAYDRYESGFSKFKEFLFRKYA